MSTNTNTAAKRVGLSAAVLALGVLGGLGIGAAAYTAADVAKPAQASNTTTIIAPPPSFTVHVGPGSTISDLPQNVPFTRPTIHLL